MSIGDLVTKVRMIELGYDEEWQLTSHDLLVRLTANNYQKSVEGDKK